MKDILSKVNRNDGMTVPDGYFENFATEMMAKLPEREWENPESKVMPRSIWQKVRPYVYLAAMFMGVWCMMKMFDLMSADSIGLSIENNPVIAAALDNDYFINDYFINECDVTDHLLMDDLYETGFEIGSDMMYDSEFIETSDSGEIFDSPQYPI